MTTTNTIPADPDDIAYCEFMTVSFTTSEREAVDAYADRVAGVWDSFDQLDADSIREFGQRLVDELKGYLVTWGDRIAELHHRLTVCGGGNLSQPAARFIDLEAGRWRGSRNALDVAVLDFMGVGLLADPLAGTEEADQVQPSNVVPLNR